MSIQVSYLIYPGTSGAEFIDSLVSDSIVVPAEHARAFSEKLIILPPSYQISYYERYKNLENAPMISNSGLKTMIRIQNDLPTDPQARILCNFNKVEKIDPTTFQLWMQIMRRVPKSYLWLLSPSGDNNNRQAKDNIFIAAASYGISQDRIIYAKRVSKEEHILRHAAADLFVDTIVYGAHSTSTDALRGGLPVLSVNGGSFPNRVIASLYQSFYARGNTKEKYRTLDLLICQSLMEYEDMTVFLLTEGAHTVLTALWTQIRKYVHQRKGIFDVTKSSLTFIRSMMAVREIRVSPLINYGVHNIGPNGVEGEMDTSMNDKDLPPQNIQYHLIVT